jgi:hypothetical protein
MPWILHDAYLLGDVAHITLRETGSGELFPMPPDFRRPGETDTQLDTRQAARVAETIAGLDIYLTRRINTRGRWQPRAEPGGK